MEENKMSIIGYSRVSTNNQKLDSQILALEGYGCTKIFEEKESGRKNNRKELTLALSSLQSGDTFVVFKLDRLGRNTQQLLELMNEFHQKGIHFVSVQDHIDTTTSIGKFIFTIMSAFAEMESDLNRSRTKAGLVAARNKGKVLGRPPINKKIIEKALTMYHSGHYTVHSISKICAISERSIYYYLKKNKNQSPDNNNLK